MACLMVETAFPEHVGFNIIIGLTSAGRKHAEIAQECQKGGLNLALRGTMVDLCAEGGASASPNSLPVSGVLEKMDDVKQSLRQTINVAHQNDGALTDLKKSTRRMENSAKNFANTAKVARWKYQLERYKWYATVGIIGFSIFLICLVWSI